MIVDRPTPTRTTTLNVPVMTPGLPGFFLWISENSIESIPRIELAF